MLLALACVVWSRQRPETVGLAERGRASGRERSVEQAKTAREDREVTLVDGDRPSVRPEKARAIHCGGMAMPGCRWRVCGRISPVASRRASRRRPRRRVSRVTSDTTSHNYRYHRTRRVAGVPVRRGRALGAVTCAAPSIQLQTRKGILMRSLTLCCLHFHDHVDPIAGSQTHASRLTLGPSALRCRARAAAADPG